MIRIGVICPSEIAFRRFMPALSKCGNEYNFIGIAVASKQEWSGSEMSEDSVLQNERQKAERFTESYGGKIFDSYKSLIESDEIDAVYLPLPPALHYKWGKKVLEAGKNLFMEKPFTTSYKDSCELIELAQKKGLKVHENYMFVYHNQIDYIKKMIADNQFGSIRLIRCDFGFPFRGANDFRYNKVLGGGALIDCGGYTIRLASELLGNTVKLVTSKLNYSDEFDVDIAGSATLQNKDGLTAQVSFGMDNTYRCSLEIWGSNKSLYTNRILTAPVGYEPEIVISSKDGDETIKLSDDDTFYKSLMDFYEKVKISKCDIGKILLQAKLIDNFFKGNIEF